MPPQSQVRECSIARSLQMIGEKWTLLVVREILFGNRRFDQIQRYTGAPRDILAARLRKLESDGIVERSQYQTRPDRFEYRLTALGKSLEPVLMVLRAWGDEHLSGTGGPPAHFQHVCGAPLDPVVTCAACGAALHTGEVALVSAAGSAAAVN